MSGAMRGASDDDFPDLPPLSEPPPPSQADERAAGSGAAKEESRVVEQPRREPLDAGPQATKTRALHAPPDGGRRDDPEAAPLLLNNKFRVIGPLDSRDPEMVVHLAVHTGTGRHVELHMLAPGIAADSPAGQRLLRAARGAGRVPHGNILSVVDSATDDEGRSYIVYEHFAGKSADELVERHGPFSPRLAAEVMCQLLEALHALHARGVFHRNIRPENLLIENVQGRLRIKLTGFAYAVVTGKNAQLPELPKGYSRYRAPEARRGLESASTGVDIYAAGVLMRFLLTGQTDPSIELDGLAARTVLRATQDDPDERFQNAESFLSAVSLMIPVDDGPESLAPPDRLAADFKYMQQRLERSGAHAAPAIGAGKLELYAALMMIEAAYAHLGMEGWQRLIGEVREVEALLPAAGQGEHFHQHGVPVELVARMLAAADAIGGNGDLSWLLLIGETMSSRGLSRLCPQLPKMMTPDALVACVPVLWTSFARDGEVVIFEQLASSARIGVRGQLEPRLETSAVLAGMLRAQLRELAATSQLSVIASEALGDAADIYELSWG